MRKSQDSLRVLAEETGGVAVVNQNDFDKALSASTRLLRPRLLLEQPGPVQAEPANRGEGHKPGLDIWSRKGYAIKAPPKPKVEKDKK